MYSRSFSLAKQDLPPLVFSASQIQMPGKIWGRKASLDCFYSLKTST